MASPQQLEQLWVSGQYSDYYIAARNFIQNNIRIPDLRFEQYQNVLAVATNCVRHQVPSEILGSQIDLATKSDIVIALGVNDLNSKSCSDSELALLKLQISQLILSFSAQIKSEIISDYQDRFVVANVMPPQGVSNAIAGMSPAAISDPFLRAQYEEAIKTNSINSINNSRQRFLLRALNLISPAIQKYSLQSSDRLGASSNFQKVETITAETSHLPASLLRSNKQVALGEQLTSSKEQISGDLAANNLSIQSAGGRASHGTRQQKSKEWYIYAMISFVVLVFGLFFLWRKVKMYEK